MKNDKEFENKKEAIEILKELSKLLDERIVDLHEVRGGMQSRHAYCYYREHVWNALKKLGGYKV